MPTKAELEEKLAEYEKTDIGKIVAENELLKAQLNPEIDEELYPRIRFTNLQMRKISLGAELKNHEIVVNQIAKAGNYRVVGTHRVDAGEFVEILLVMQRD